MEATFRVLIELFQIIEHKMNLFNMRIEMVEKSFEQLRSKSLVGATSKQLSDPLLPSSTFKIPEPTCAVGKIEPT